MEEWPLEYSGYGVTTAIPYGLHDGLILDLYEPEGDARSSRPLVILAPGGGFNYCIPSEMAPHAKFLARFGFVCAAIAYRTGDGLVSRAHYLQKVAAAVSDLRAAIRFFRHTAAVYRIDTENIFIGGHSSGAILCLHAAYIKDLSEVSDPDFLSAIELAGGLEGDSGNPGYPSDVRGVINLSGAVFDLDILDSGDPLLLSIHGQDDPYVPYSVGEKVFPDGYITLYGSERIHGHIMESGLMIPGRLIAILGGDHAGPMNGEYFETIRDFILAHLDRSGAEDGHRSGN